MTSFLPLKNIRVLDFSRLIPGPFCTKILSDLGAKITRVEDPSRPDFINMIPPEVLPGVTATGVWLNKNKSKLSVDLSSISGQRQILSRIRNTDVLLESFRPGVMKKIGLDYPRLKKLNPKLVYVSLTGYGQKGDWAQKAGHDINFLAASGFLELLHNKVPSYQIADFVGGGLFGALNIVSALMEKPRGRHLDVAMTANLVYLSQHLRYAGIPPDLKVIQGGLARYGVYFSSDGACIALGALEDKFWMKFCKGLKRQNWLSGKLTEPELQQELKNEFASKSSSYWKKFSRRHDCCLTVSFGAEEMQKAGWMTSESVRYDDHVIKLTEATALRGGKKSRMAR